MPEGVGSGTNISAWHDIVGKQNSQSPPELPPDIPSADLSEVTVIYEYQSNGTDNVEIVNFTQKVGFPYTGGFEVRLTLYCRILWPQ